MGLFSREPQPQAPLPFPAGSAEELAARWVRWAASNGPSAHPVADRTGAWAGHGQPEDVWFLAGTFGLEGVVRRVHLPAGRPLFFPAFNFWSSPVEAPGLPALVPLAFGLVRVDGADQRVTPIGTAPFEVAGARLNPVTRTRRPVAVEVWGLWVHLDHGLAPGEHTIKIRGGDGESFHLSVDYELTAA